MQTMTDLLAFAKTIADETRQQIMMRREGRQVYYSLNQDAVAICCGVILQRFAPEQEIWSLQPHQPPA